MIAEQEQLSDEYKKCMKDLDKALEEKLKQQKLKCYYKKQCSNFRKQDSGKFCSSRISDLENEIKALQNEKNEAQEKLQEVIQEVFYPTTETERWYEGIITKKSHNNFYVRYEVLCVFLCQV